MIDELSKQGRIGFLSELIEAGVDLNNDPHLETRELYRAFLADIEAIAEAARQMFPAVEPPEEVWEHIELAINQTRN